MAPRPIETARPPETPALRCPFCTADRLLERLSGGWILCNVCAKTFRPAAG